MGNDLPTGFVANDAFHEWIYVSAHGKKSEEISAWDNDMPISQDSHKHALSWCFTEEMGEQH